MSQYNLGHHGDWWSCKVDVLNTAYVLDYVFSDAAKRSWDNNAQQVGTIHSACCRLNAFLDVSCQVELLQSATMASLDSCAVLCLLCCAVLCCAVLCCACCAVLCCAVLQPGYKCTQILCMSQPLTRETDTMQPDENGDMQASMTSVQRKAVRYGAAGTCIRTCCEHIAG